jgi:tRNA threonylcarbamoyladenosine biosynthesis protein TsaB
LSFSGKRKLYGVSTLQALSCFAAEPDKAAVVIRARKDYWYLRLCGQESFDSTDDVLAKLSGSLPKFAVVDATARDDARLTEFFSANGVKTVLDEGNPLSLWARLFLNHEPSLIQEANYIQPSYFEKGH